VLNRASIQVNTFPSGHVAAALASALAVGALFPMAGTVIGLLALSIAGARLATRPGWTPSALVVRRHR